MFKKILVATDGSSLSEKAVESAIEMARHHSAELVVFTVARRPPKSYMDGSTVRESVESESIDKQRQETAQALVAAIGERARGRGVSCHPLVAHSSQVAESIIAAAGNQACDLIVMASHGRKGLGRLLIGSETQHVLTHSTLPVLVLR
ncbi:universal stress protein [Variovorax sp. J31P207]|uniref:universal stress protein n=1 Tax=Variovorax sp. J31P207 TaxID=3053510 RepID=UPI0025752401|nr:universal stress protein [Variovorax sp. J31P207]MDM0072256.1 universal stress protein [Variovorax sp. J31P207]